MADSMRDIKRRIKSVSSTKQITHAMELVASSKLRKTRQKADARRAYTKYMIECMHVIANGMQQESQNIYLKSNSTGKDMYIVISSDKGLAGGFNSNVLKYALDKMADSDAPTVCAVGLKSLDFFTRRKIDVSAHFTGESETPDFTLARNIGRTVTTMFLEQKVNNVYIIYNRFVSLMSQTPDVIKLLPLTDKELRSNEDKIDTTSYTQGIDVDTAKVNKLQSVMCFEPDADTLADGLIPKYFDNAIYGALLESAAGELAARRMAMESATDNADELIDGLTLKYNRARQGAITQEITEIVSGAEAIS